MHVLLKAYPTVNNVYFSSTMVVMYNVVHFHVEKNANLGIFLCNFSSHKYIILSRVALLRVILSL
jgi:hypothetical protein